MGMGMMPMMSTQVNSNTPPPNKPKKLIPQEIPTSDKKDEKPPVTTVFVGNISDRAPDAMIRQMLQRCGNVLSWKRVQGASGKLQAFGFCEYEDPEATLRCIRLLNEWQIIDKKLVVKVDAKTRTLLDDYKRKKKEKEKGPGQIAKDKKEEDGDKEEGEADDETSTLDDPLDEFTMREDRVAKAGLDAIMREYAEDLNKEPPAGRDGADREKKERKKAKEKEPVRDGGIDDMNIEDEKKDLISREIRSFRDAHKVGRLTDLFYNLDNIETPCIALQCFGRR